jgi:hypothetical protein
LIWIFFFFDLFSWVMWIPNHSSWDGSPSMKISWNLTIKKSSLKNNTIYIFYFIMNKLHFMNAINWYIGFLGQTLFHLDIWWVFMDWLSSH